MILCNRQCRQRIIYVLQVAATAYLTFLASLWPLAIVLLMAVMGL